MAEINWFEALGAKRPEGGPGEAETVETPEAPETTETTETPEVPAEGAEGLEPAQEDGAESSDPEGGEAAGELTKEQRAENARRRRERENRELEERVRAEERAKSEEHLNSFIISMGLTDSEGKSVATLEQYEAFVRERDKRIVDEELGRLGLDGNVFNTLINNHPAVIEARRVAEAARLAERRGLETSAEARAKEQLTEIQKLDPGIKTMDDLRGHESFEKVYAFTQSGLSIADAFKAANLDAIRERDRRAAAQQAINAAQSKGHMTPPDGGRGKMAEPIPEGIRRSYRNMFGDISDEEIRKKYERISKQKG